MATTTDLKSVARKGLRVRVPPSPPFLMHQITNVILPNKHNQDCIANFISQPNQRWILHVLFLRIPKNASSSMMQLLGNYNLIKKHEQKFISQADKKVYKGWFDPTHATQEEVYKVLREDARKSFSFCIVRNPCLRLVFSGLRPNGKVYLDMLTLIYCLWFMWMILSLPVLNPIWTKDGN